MKNTERSEADPSGCEACPPGKHSSHDPKTKLAVCNTCPLGTLQWRSNQSACLDCTTGLRCEDRSHLNVRNGFFLVASTWDAAVNPVPVRCPFLSTCRGGITSSTQCIPGSTGPLCGQCAGPDPGPAYYRADGTCIQCPDTSESLAGTFALIILGVLALLFAVFAYLRSSLGVASPLIRIAAVGGARAPPWLSRRLRVLTRLSLRQVSTILKIIVSYCQMLFVFGKLSSVHWPPIFQKFVQDINISLVVGVEAWLGRLFLPLSCKTGELSAYTWLALTLVIPPACSAITFALAAAARASTGASGSREALLLSPPSVGNAAGSGDDEAIEAGSGGKAGGGDGDAAGGAGEAGEAIGGGDDGATGGGGDGQSLAPALFTIHTWLLLLLYPSLSRATLSTFICTELEHDVYYLNEDTGQRCFDNAQWQSWAAVAAIGFAVYSVGSPVAFFVLTRRWHNASSEQRRRLGRRLELLLASYTEECWWFEAADLVRKLFLTSLIILIAPGTRVQIWFGLVTSVIATIATMQRAPYRDKLCQNLQSAMMLQITFNYISATVFFVQPGVDGDGTDPATSGFMGPLLIVVNLAAFALLLATTLRGTHSVLTAKAARWAEDGALALAGQPAGTYHCFVSHQWGSGQDQARAIKSQLTALVPDMRCFLDVDDLTSIESLEALVGASDALLIFLSGSVDGGTERSDYMRSANCLRELKAAVHAKKPIVFVHETDPKHGGVAMETHRQDCPEPLRHVLDEHPIVPWYRARSFMLVSLRLILKRILHAEVRIPGEMHPLKLTPPPPLNFHLYVSSRNDGAAEVTELLTAEAERLGAGELLVTHNPDEAARAQHFLLYCNGETHDEAVWLHHELEIALRNSQKLLLVHEQRRGRRDVDFGSIIKRTPKELLQIYQQELAVPLYDGEEHTRSCLYAMLKALASDSHGRALGRPAPGVSSSLTLQSWMERAHPKKWLRRVRTQPANLSHQRNEPRLTLMREQDHIEIGPQSGKLESFKA